MLLEHEIAEERSVGHLGLKVLAPGGWVPVTHVCRTIPMEVLRVVTEGHQLECSAKHRIITPAGPVPADQLEQGMLVVTDRGLEQVVTARSTGEVRELYDLRVDAADHLYFSGGIASHNSTGLGAAELFKLNVIPNYRSLYITPMHDQLKTLAEKFMDMQRGSIYPAEYNTSRGVKNSMYYKGSTRGGFLRLMHILTDAGKARGISANSVVLDECEIGSTIVTCVGKDLVLTELKIGDKLLAHDDQYNIRIDTVRSITPKGYRHTWAVTTRTGRQLTCTGNARIRTPSGWRYLAEFITAEACAVCPVSAEVKSTKSGSLRHGDGDHAGRRELLDTRRCVPQISGKPLRGAEGLLPEQAGPTAGLHYLCTGEGSGQSGLGFAGGSVLDYGVADLRIFTLSMLPARSAASGILPEDRHSGVGGSTELAASGVVVSGRRGDAESSDGVRDTLIHPGGVRQVVQMVDRERRDSRDQKGPEGEPLLLECSRHDGCCRDADGEATTIYASVDALQASGIRTGPDLHHLRVAGEASDHARADVEDLLGHLPEGSATASHHQVLRHHDPCCQGGVSEAEVSEGARQVAAGPRSPHTSESEDGRAGTREAQGHRLGGSLQRAEACLEEAPQSCRQPGEAVPDAHLHVLSQPVPEQPYAQHVEAQRLYQLPSGRVHDATEGGRAGAGTPAGEAAPLQLVEDSIVSITYAGVQEVFDVETEKHHTLFADGIAVHNCQNFDAEHLGEIAQVQKAFVDTRTTVFAGTSLDLDTCLEHQFQIGSRGIWHIHCTCKDKWHPLNDKALIPKMMSVDGLRCPHSNRLLNPMIGEFVHEDTRMLKMKQVSFHLPQLIVPEYASGEKFISIWKDFKRWSEKQFLQEVMGIPVESGVSELNEAELKACCTDKTFAQIQDDYLSGRVRYPYLFSGCDWGGSDWNRATKVKQSYTVHTIYGLTADGYMDLIYAFRYAGMNYQDIAGTIVEAHNKFKVFAIGTDNGGGSYYNAYMRDCGRIPTNKIISFNYTDTKLLLERIPHPEAHIMSLHRTDSLSALINDVKNKRIRFPRWDDSAGFVLDFLNMRRNITESQSGRAVMRYVRHGAKADDFMQSTNYACMMKRITTMEPLIPNRQILDELGALFGTRVNLDDSAHVGLLGGHFSG